MIARNEQSCQHRALNWAVGVILGLMLIVAGAVGIALDKVWGAEERVNAVDTKVQVSTAAQQVRDSNTERLFSEIKSDLKDIKTELSKQKR
jgi:hypothetical protein